MTIGDTSAWPIAEARKRVAELRRIVDTGGDPLGDLEQKRIEPTVAGLIKRFEEEALPSRALRTAAEYKAMLDQEGLRLRQGLLDGFRSTTCSMPIMVRTSALGTATRHPLHELPGTSLTIACVVPLRYWSVGNIPDFSVDPISTFFPKPQRPEEAMYRQFGVEPVDALRHPDLATAPIVHPGGLDALVALDQLGGRRSFSRDAEIYAEGDQSDCWFRVIAGTVRICKTMADGRRHIAEFCFSGDCFGLDAVGERGFSAEAVGEVIVMRYPRQATDRLIDENLHVARQLCELTLRDLAHAQTRMLRLGRMTAPERVASFLLELATRRDARQIVDVPMSRTDIADYLGLTIETICRVLSAFKRDGTIGIPNAHRIELRDRDTLAAICEP